MRNYRSVSKFSRLRNVPSYEDKQVTNTSNSGVWIVFWAIFSCLFFVIITMVLVYQLRPNVHVFEEGEKTDIFISKPVYEQDLSLKSQSIDNQPFSIYADTALSPLVHDSSIACLAHAKATVKGISGIYKLTHNLGKKNVLYLKFSGSLNNYIIRCFNIDEGYQIFISGSSINAEELNRFINIIYNQLS